MNAELKSPEVLQAASPGLDRLKFDNSFVRELPADTSLAAGQPASVRRQLREACYADILPTPTANPQLLAHSAEMAEELGFSAADCASEEFARVFSGNALLPGMQPFATCYGGHQFGNWAGQLGDGRAINLGEVLDVNGVRQVLQLKGAGPTPFSRTADGLAVLRSSVREFLCSEAMHHLGVPTTRALSLCLTGDEVLRDMLYDGNAAMEPGAVVCRVSPSFIRFGHYQMLAARGEQELLEQFLNYNISTDFPELASMPAGAERTLAWFAEVARRTAVMVAHWTRVGFVHGVMNTDNMSVLGETIDYGPYGWLEDYDPNWTPNTTDAQGKRYRFAHQPAVAQWNLLQLANAIFPLIEQAEPLEKILSEFEHSYIREWHNMLGNKLGLAEFRSQDAELAEALDLVLQVTEVDMTIFYRSLAELDVTDASAEADFTAVLSPSLYDPATLAGEVRDAWNGWLQNYAARVREDNVTPEARRAQMNAVNPKYVLRNYLAQLAIDAAEGGDYSRISRQLEVLRNPYTDQPGCEEFAARRPDWARTRVGCSMLSCSS